MKSMKVMKYGLMAIVLLLLVYVLGRCVTEFYTVIESVPQRSHPPEGYSTGGVCMTGFYDWTRGQHLVLPMGAEGVVTDMDRYRSREAPDLSACIPNTWEVTTIANLRAKMTSFASK